jgi:hypothetical protein
MSFDFGSPASAADVRFGLGIQPNKGAVATAVHEVIHTGGDEGPGLLIDQGELEVGGGYYSGNRARKTGARPNFSAAGRAYLRALALMLRAAGFQKASVGGTPAVLHLTPATQSAQIPYVTFVSDYGAVGPKVQHIDGRVAGVEVNVVSGQPVRAGFSGQGRVHQVSALTPTADPNRLELAAVADVLAANAMIWGEDDVCFRALDLVVTQLLFSDNQCIGSDVPSDIVPTGMLLSISGVLACNDEIYRALAFGDEAATTTGAGFKEGQFRIRISTDGDIGPTAPNDVPGYMQVDMANARYWLPANVATVPGRDVTCPFVAQCLAPTDFSIDLMDGSDYAWLA